MAKEAKKGLTIGMKTESRFLDTLENIATKSFFGAEELIGRKEALAFVGQAAQKDFIENATQGLNKTDLGTLFFDSMVILLFQFVQNHSTHIHHHLLYHLFLNRDYNRMF